MKKRKKKIFSTLDQSRALCSRMCVLDDGVVVIVVVDEEKKDDKHAISSDLTCVTNIVNK